MYLKILEFIRVNNVLFLSTALIIFLLLAYYGVQNVGYYYDELLHAVATQETIQGAGYHSEVHRVIKYSVAGHIVPLMILYYVGPLKSFALLLPFGVFSSSLIVLRSVTILCGAITLIATYKLVKHNISQKTAVITTILLSTDPTFIISSRYDWGPIAIQNILKLLILILFFRVRSQQRLIKSLVLLGAGSALMLWDKLNALWFLVPLAIMLISTLRHHILLLRYTALGFLICIIPLLLIFIKRPFFYTESQKSFTQFENYYYQNKSNANLETLLGHYQSAPGVKLKNIVDTLNGVAIPNQILTSPLKSSTVFGFVFAVLGLIISVRNYSVLKSLIKKRQFTSPYIYIVFLAVTIVFTILLTPHASAPHHVLLVYPLFHILLAGLLATLYPSQKVLASLILALLIISNLTVLSEFNKNANANAMRIFWKRNDLSSLVEHLQNNKGKYVALDWGITLPIGFISKGSISIRDLQAFYEPKCKELQGLIDQGYSAILYTQNNLVFPTYYSECQAELSQLTPEKISDYMIYKNRIVN